MTEDYDVICLVEHDGGTCLTCLMPGCEAPAKVQIAFTQADCYECGGAFSVCEQHMRDAANQLMDQVLELRLSK